MRKSKLVSTQPDKKSTQREVQEALSKIPEAQAKVTRLNAIHAKLCQEVGDSGSVRQQLEDAESYLDQLKGIVRKHAS